MAIIRSGVLGNTRGKVAGVVGSQWKDKNYLREYVKPANPNTAAQQTQRTKMSDCVAFAKNLVGPVFNAYTDRFQKSMSGFNFFIKQNIDEFDGSIDYSALLLTEGKLHPPGTFDPEYDSATGDLEFKYDATEGNNGDETDAIFGVCYDKNADLFYFFDAEAARNGTSNTIALPTGLTATNLECFIWAAQYSGTIVNLISNSVHDTAEAV